ncbi:unnamed protein product [Parnassius apollo]|uniref:(apollo) hypothetical protein n=1 Tax=Parnassius apollo TaxID=110799 RepID=A0A8S3XWB9_PARAO|nr:unnamed protein product [Parnassius apollo]
MDLIHRLHYLVLSQKSDLMTMEREKRMRMRRQSSLPEYSRAQKTRHRLEQAFLNDRELFAAKADSGAAAADRKLSSSSAGSMKNKWLKAFRSLKPPSAPPPHPGPQDKKNQMYHAVSTVMAMRRNGAARDAMRSGGESEAHNFQEYTYKKITPCDICSQVLRGHTRQGLRCRICKMNVHTDCMPQVGKCQTKSKLLRRQKSTSEIESHRVQETAFEEEKSEETTTRPFGQPLCFVKENGDPPPSILKPTASFRKKK